MLENHTEWPTAKQRETAKTEPSVFGIRCVAQWSVGDGGLGSWFCQVAGTASQRLGSISLVPRPMVTRTTPPPVPAHL